MDDEALARWLVRREALDAASRSELLADRISSWLGSRDPVRLVDLATGTGSNIRYLAERLPGRRQQWLAIDRSATLLSRLTSRMDAWATTRGYTFLPAGTGCAIRGSDWECQVETRQMDLGMLSEDGRFGTPDVVTASSLLDLVSESWLRSLAAHCRRWRAAALFAITYNGRSSCSPPDQDDALVLRLFNRHQRTDKGLGGPAAGPDAVAAVVRCFGDAGYLVGQEPSDWHIGADERELQKELIEGWAEAAAAIAPDSARTIAAWRERRLRHVEDGASEVIVGHEDVAAWLPTDGPAG
jgi:hypothetical protein